MTTVFTLLFCLLIYNLADAHVTNLNFLPNSGYIRIAPGKTRCQICHEQADPEASGITTHNTFGQDFKANGKKWDATLGLKNSDTDGYNNATELSCFNWSWSPGSGDCGSHTGELGNPGDGSVTPVIAAEVAPLQSGLFALRAEPNPFNAGVMISVSLPGNGPSSGRLFLFDMAGKQIRSFEIRGPRAAVHWNGRAENGTALPSGVYGALLSSGKKNLTVRLTLAR